MGYMNRGVHEGQVGVAVYYFDAEKIPLRKKHLSLAKMDII